MGICEAHIREMRCALFALQKLVLHVFMNLAYNPGRY